MRITWANWPGLSILHCTTRTEHFELHNPSLRVVLITTVRGGHGQNRGGAKGVPRILQKGEILGSAFAAFKSVSFLLL